MKPTATASTTVTFKADEETRKAIDTLVARLDVAGTIGKKRAKSVAIRKALIEAAVKR